jgi:flagellar hook-basal body complex protein FliE
MSGALNSIFGNGNIFGALLGAASLFFPPLAIAGSLSNLLTQAVGEAVKQAVTQLVQEQGAPKFLKDLVGDIVDKAVAQNQQPSSPDVDAHTQAQAGGAINDIGNDMSKSIVDNAVENIKNTKKSKGSGSWLEALAEALGQALDAQAQKVQDLSSQITDSNAKDKPSTMTELQTASQRLSFMMNAADQVIKTIGEALATSARKQ